MVIYCDKNLSGQLVDFSFGWFLIVILKYISYRDRRAKELDVLKCWVNILVLFLIEECAVQVSWLSSQ